VNAAAAGSLLTTGLLLALALTPRVVLRRKGRGPADG